MLLIGFDLLVNSSTLVSVDGSIRVSREHSSRKLVNLLIHDAARLNWSCTYTFFFPRGFSLCEIDGFAIELCCISSIQEKGLS